jgi:hypothetical protein
VLLFFLENSRNESKYSLIISCLKGLGDSADNAKMIKLECFGTLKTIFATLITKKLMNDKPAGMIHFKAQCFSSATITVRTLLGAART